MKFAIAVLLGVLLLGPIATLQAADPAGASQVAIGFTGGSVWTSPSTGICIWYLPLVGELDLKSLFMGPLFGAPVADREHAYLIWVSDVSAEVLPANKDFNLVALVPTGTGTIYFSNTPDRRDWKDLTNRSTWGNPVATFVRKAGIYPSADGGASATFIFSADLVSSRTFPLNGKAFNFRDLLPHGMTCFERAVGAAEAGTCIAAGGGS